MNSSFDIGELRIAYHGKNRNGSSISKEAFEAAIPSMYNCPVVCNYTRETDSIGSHDVEFVNDDKGMRMVNITQPVGVVPESAEYRWRTIEEDDGTEHEYLCADVLMWKRQEAYSHIKENCVTSESMEIKINAGATEDDGCYRIDAFEFLAFCLLESANPCFESACVEMFSENDFKAQYTKMMEDFKREFASVSSTKETSNFAKGGNDDMDMKELLGKYNLTEENIEGMNFDGMSQEEIEHKFAEIKEQLFANDENDDPDASADNAESDADNAEGEPAAVEPESDDDDDDDEATKRQEFSLTGEQLRDAFIDALRAVTYNDPYWGEMFRYSYCDYDLDNMEVFVHDYTDWKLYGMKYSMNGDNVVIDFSNPVRKRVTYVDFDNGTAEFSCKDMFTPVIDAFNKKIEAANGEIEELRKYKADRELADNKDRVDAVFSNFADLEGDERFESLKKEVADAAYSMTSENIEDKCFAIRGRKITVKFSANEQPKPIRVPAKDVVNNDEPYGGIFAKYGFNG